MKSLEIKSKSIHRKLYINIIISTISIVIQLTNFLLFLIPVMFITSCTKNSSNISFTGKWKFQSIAYTNPNAVQLNSKEDLTELNAVGLIYENYIIEFNSDSTFKSEFPELFKDLKISGKYQIINNGSTLIMKSDIKNKAPNIDTIPIYKTNYDTLILGILPECSLTFLRQNK